VRNRVESAQAICTINLGQNRNALMRMQLHLAMAGVSLATATTVAGVFGMNLVNSLEESAHAFLYVNVLCGLLCMGVYGGSWLYVRREEGVAFQTAAGGRSSSRSMYARGAPSNTHCLPTHTAFQHTLPSNTHCLPTHAAFQHTLLPTHPAFQHTLLPTHPDGSLTLTALLH
jgi:hypothetical protein